MSECEPAHDGTPVTRVCLLNNYSIETMWDRVRSGSVPAQHLWGADAILAAGHELDIAPFHEASERNLLDRLSRRARHLLGHLDQEVYAARRLRRTDVLYCADQGGLSGLALAHRMLYGKRIIAVVHHPIRHPAKLAAASRHDVLVCLSPQLVSELRPRLSPRTKLAHLPWGPDLTSPLYATGGESNGVVSSGKSNRDLPILLDALKRSDAPGLLYDLEGQLPAGGAGPVRIVRPGDGDGVDPNSPTGYLAGRVIRDTAAAAIVAIPVAEPHRLTGLTEAVDALALGKPIVATRSPYFPFDIEAVGCGIWVEPGDLAGWTGAITKLWTDPQARRSMGAAGRAFAETQWNYARFCHGLLELIA